MIEFYKLILYARLASTNTTSFYPGFSPIASFFIKGFFCNHKTYNQLKNMTSVDKQLHDAYSSILIMTSVDKHDVSRHKNMTSLETHTHTQTTYFYIYRYMYVYIWISSLKSIWISKMTKTI